MKDEMIVDLFYERSEHAISELSSKYGKLAQGICVNILHNSSDAEECVNDSLFTTWNSIPPERPASLKAYFIHIARNEALDRYRYNTSSKRNSYEDEPIDELQESLSSGCSLEKECEAGELSQAINSFLSTLKKADRQIFVSRYYLSDPIHVIAIRIGLKDSVVTLRLHRIRAKLRKYLQKENLI